MSPWGLWAVLLALALPAGSALTLQCKAAAAATLPCCQEGMADCGQPGMTQACCQMTSASHDGVAVSPAGALPESSLQYWSLAPVHGIAALLMASLASVDPQALDLPSVSPPYTAPVFSRTSVLRI